MNSLKMRRVREQTCLNGLIKVRLKIPDHEVPGGVLNLTAKRIADTVNRAIYQAFWRRNKRE